MNDTELVVDVIKNLVISHMTLRKLNIPQLEAPSAIAF